jgi:precorrin-4 C11-methyltransferase
MEQTAKRISKKSSAAGRVFFIGAGPGDPELLTVKGQRLLGRADVIIYAGSLVNPAVLARAKKSAGKLDSASMTLQEITAEMVRAARKGKLVVRLHSGEPSLYGAIAEQMDILRRQDVPYDVVPGVTAAFAAAAALKKEFTVPGFSQTLIITRRAGRTPVPEKEALASLAAHRASMAIYLSTGMLDDAMRELVAGGYPEDTPAAVVYRASWPDETVVRGTLATIASQVKQKNIKRQALILVGDAISEKKGQRSKLYAEDFSHGFRQQKEKKRAGTAVIAVTKDGAKIGNKIAGSISGARLFLPAAMKGARRRKTIIYYTSLQETVREVFSSCAQIICIMAAGIAVRMIAPCVTSKWDDPAVAVMDDQGKNIISLLSGHWGGANKLARDLSQMLGGHCVITTASDTRELPALDVIIQQLGAGEFSREALKKIQAAMIAGNPVGFFPAELRLLPGMEGHGNLCFYDCPAELFASDCRAGLVFSHDNTRPAKKAGHFLFIHPRDLAAGIGCNRGVTARDMQAAVEKVFKKMKLPLAALHSIGTIAAKKDEQGLLRFARANGLLLRFYSAAQLNSVVVPSAESVHARRALGVQGVAEPAALLAAQGGELLMKKEKLGGLTLALARVSFARLIAERVLAHG